MFSKIFEELSPTTTKLLAGVTAILVVYVVRWMWVMINTPGPWGIPILGYYPFLGKDFHIRLKELSEKYGDVYRINILGQDFLYLNSLAAIKEAHVAKAECFTARPQKQGVLYDSLKNGLAFLEGEHWRVQRKFFVQGMKEIGLAKNSQELHGPVLDAIQVTMDLFKESKGKPIDIYPMMSKQCTDTVQRLILGDKVSQERVMELNALYETIVKPMMGKNLLLLGKRAKDLILSRQQDYKEMTTSTKKMAKLLYEILEDHKSVFNPDQPPSDFIDAYLNEKHIKEKKGDPQAKYYTDLDLVSTLIQAYGDGSTSVGLFVGILFRSFSFRREAQDEIYEEIIKNIGQERLPTWEDRTSLILINSAIKESLRTINFANVFPGMECIKDTTVMGVKAPKGCVTLMNFWASNTDSRIFKDPEKFDTSRFMPGKSKSEPLIFGVGKRACAGEGLVMTELFLFLAAIIQNFVLLPEYDGEPEDDNEDFATLLSKKIRAIPRPGGRYSTEV